METLLRLSIAVSISLLGIALYFALTQLRLASLRRAHHPLADLGLRRGVPAIVYFTTPDCAPCRTVQGPAIEQVRAQFGERLQIVKIDASARTDLADRWQVLSVPTTFILDARGQPRQVNNGVASAHKLRQQLREFTTLDEPNGTLVGTVN